MTTSFLQNLLTGGQNILDGVSRSAARYTNVDFLRAITAGSALIVAADGIIEDDEIDGFVDMATTNPVLKNWDAKTKMDLFKQNLNLAKDKYNQAQLMGDIAKFAGKPEAVTIAEVICLLAAADGNVADSEKKMLKRIIGRALGLNADQYIDG